MVKKIDLQRINPKATKYTSIGWVETVSALRYILWLLLWTTTCNTHWKHGAIVFENLVYKNQIDDNH